MPALRLDTVILRAQDGRAALEFYRSVFAPDSDTERGLRLHGAGNLLVAPAPASAHVTGFAGFTVSYILDQPSEVDTIIEKARAAGAAVRKPPKKGFFGGYSGVIEAPDGSVWKVACEKKKDTSPAATSPIPRETVVILGGADPVATRDFYVSLGMKTDRDYGRKFIDFTVEPESSRLALMTHDALAKDAGFDSAGVDTNSLVLAHYARSPEEADLLLASAARSGATVVAASRTGETYSGSFTDPDGYAWRVTAL